jgi:hypothetical protein
MEVYQDESFPSTQRKPLTLISYMQQDANTQDYNGGIAPLFLTLALEGD